MIIELQYFREGGKYYASGQYETALTTHHEIVDEVRRLKFDQRLPGLVEGAIGFHTLIQFPKDTPLDVPRLIPYGSAR